jgi:hypothetical protein
MSDALFLLACGCVLDGYADAQPALAWRKGIHNGVLHCAWHRRPTVLSGLVALTSQHDPPATHDQAGGS